MVLYHHLKDDVKETETSLGRTFHGKKNKNLILQVLFLLLRNNWKQRLLTKPFKFHLGMLDDREGLKQVMCYFIQTYQKGQNISNHSYRYEYQEIILVYGFS